jgi:hypothetical protein
MQSPIFALLSLLLLAFSNLTSSLPTVEAKERNTDNQGSIFTDNSTPTSPAFEWIDGPSLYPFSLESSGSYLILYGESTTFTNTFPTPWSIEPVAVTVTNTFSDRPSAPTQTQIINELIFFGASTTYKIMFGDLATTTASLPVSQWTPIWTVGTAVNFSSLAAGSGFATNIASSTSSQTPPSTVTSTSSTFATATALPGAPETSVVGFPTSTSKAAAETLVAGLGALVGVALGAFVDL